MIKDVRSDTVGRLKTACLALSFAWLMLSATSAAPADKFPPEGLTQTQSEESPQGTFRIVYFRKDPAEVLSDSQIWLQALQADARTQLLFTYSDDASCSISPDENFIAIKNHVIDGWDDVDAFVRNKEGIYKEARRHLLAAALKLMVKQLRLKRVPQFDFQHCFTDAWLRDGLLLCHLEAHASAVSKLDEWYFIYDIRNDRFRWDLCRINQGAFHLIH